jgi:hypothetical protein
MKREIFLTLKLSANISFLFDANRAKLNVLSLKNTSLGQKETHGVGTFRATCLRSERSAAIMTNTFSNNSLITTKRFC